LTARLAMDPLREVSDCWVGGKATGCLRLQDLADVVLDRHILARREDAMLLGAEGELVTVVK
jgi:hypothetical protein